MLKSLMKKILIFIIAMLSYIDFSKSKLSTDKARKILTDCSPKPSGTGIAENKIVEPTCDLQIIVPAYNVEKYLKSCIDSVLNQQTKYNYKIVLVEDGATDSTPDIADEYSNDERVVIIHQENRGFSGARNRGLETIFARYIMFLDSDDMLCPGTIESLLDCAFQTGAEIVEGSALYLTRERESVCFRHKKQEKLEYALGNLQGFPWAKVYKAELFANRRFPEGFWFEDTMLSMLVYSCTKSACFIPDFVYKYRFNPTGISNSYSGKPKTVDTYWVFEQMMQEHHTLNLPNDDLFFRKFFRAVILNQKRICGLSQEIQEAAFVLSCDLMDKYFSGCEVPKMYRGLHKILKNRNFSGYKLFCKFK